MKNSSDKCQSHASFRSWARGNQLLGQPMVNYFPKTDTRFRTKQPCNYNKSTKRGDPHILPGTGLGFAWKFSIRKLPEKPS